MVDEQPMKREDYLALSYAAAIARHLTDDDAQGANAVIDEVHQAGLDDKLLLSFASLVSNYGQRLFESKDAMRADLTDISVKMALAAERPSASGCGE